jgi:hypothetical protein
MTISYNNDVSSSQYFTFLRIIFRWRGSIWKSVIRELIFWLLGYYCVLLLYRYVLVNFPEVRQDFVNFSRHTDNRLRYIPLDFMLAFYVSLIVDRWKQIFTNIGLVDSQAHMIATYVRGTDDDTRMVRRNMIRSGFWLYCYGRLGFYSSRRFLTRLLMNEN